METASAMAPRRARHHHPRRYKPRWEYKGVFTATASTPTKTTPTRVGHAAPLVESFLSDESMATSRSITTVASSIEAQTPSHQQQPTLPSAASSSATRARPQGRACVDDDSLATMGRVAKKRIETLARREALVGRWRRRRLATAETASSMASHRGECQVLEFQSPRHDEFKIVARMNIAGSLREIMGVLATDNAAHFHQSMAALFGAPYVTGEKLRASESLGLRRSSTQSARALLLSSHRLSTRPTPSSRLSSFVSSSASSSVSNIKIALNSVTLQLRHGFFRRRLHDWQFLDYLDEKVDAMAVTRVLQTVRAPGHSGRPSLGELFAGYVIREDPQAQFTRVFFYGDARGNSVAPYTKRLLRTMVETLVRLVATVERQRLSALYMLHRRSESVPVAAGRCFACDAGFTTAKRRHTCACCRQSVCRACLEVRAIERTGDSDGSAATKALEITHGPPCLTRVRVCRCCVDRVSLPSMADGKGQKERPLLDQGEEEDDDDEIVVVDSSSEDDSDA